MTYDTGTGWIFQDFAVVIDDALHHYRKVSKSWAQDLFPRTCVIEDGSDDRSHLIHRESLVDEQKK